MLLVKILFKKKEMKEFKNKGYKFLYLGLIQVGIKPLTQRGINAVVLLRLFDGRFTNYTQGILCMVEASLSKGPIHFNCSPDLTISLDDGAPEKALTLKINISGYQMIEGSRPLALVYRIYYKLLKTNLNPQAPKDQTLLLQASNDDIQVDIPQMIKWDEIKFPKEWELICEMPPTLMLPTQMQNIETENLNSIEQYIDGTVKIRFDHSKPRLLALLKYNNSCRSFSGSSSTSKRDQGINEYLNQLNLNKQKDIEKKDIKQKGIKEENP